MHKLQESNDGDGIAIFVPDSHIDDSLIFNKTSRLAEDFSVFIARYYLITSYAELVFHSNNNRPSRQKKLLVKMTLRLYHAAWTKLDKAM
jgi:hypothetical protein